MNDNLRSAEPARNLFPERFVSLHGVDIRKQQLLGISGRLESFREDVTLGNQFAFGGGFAVNSLDNFVELDPSVFGGGNVGGDGHDQGNKTILTSAWNRRIVDKRLAEGNGFSDVGLVVTREEEIVRHIGISGKVWQRKREMNWRK